MKITEIFNGKGVRAEKVKIDRNHSRAAKIIDVLDIEGKADILKKIETAYIKATKKFYSGIDPAKPIKHEPAKKAAKKKAAKKVAKKAPAKKAAKSKGEDNGADLVG